MNAYYSLTDLHRYQDEFRDDAAHDRLVRRLRRARRQARHLAPVVMLHRATTLPASFEQSRKAS
jgi:hypothetical protein